MSDSIKDQLQVLKGKLKTSSYKSQVDGVDHINIYSFGKTELGRMLAPETNGRFVHPIIGPFNCLTGFWAYVKSKSRKNTYRTKDARSCLNIVNKFNDAQPNVPNFKAIITSGIYYKVMSDETLKNMVKESTLPFEMYYVKTREEINPVTGKKVTYEIKVQQNYAAWMKASYEEVRRAIKDGVEPDLTKFLDKNSDGLIYKDFVGYAEIPEESEALVDQEEVHMEGQTPTSEAVDVSKVVE